MKTAGKEITIEDYFHTSKVRLKHGGVFGDERSKIHFHTSKVRLKHALVEKEVEEEKDFHTSKVRLKQISGCLGDFFEGLFPYL